MIIFTDIHGNYDTLRALLRMIPTSEKKKGMAVCGDLIDRGPKSMQVVNWAIRNKVHCVRGNHEDLAIDWYANGCSWRDRLWLDQGGRETLNSYRETAPDQYLKGEVDMEKFVKHLRWMDKLPYYLEFPKIKNADGRYLVLSHSNIGNVWKMRNTDNEKELHKFNMEVSWGRPYKIKDVPEIYNIIGHTPQEYGARIRKTYANIDTGCAYHHSCYKKLTAIQFPEMIIYEHENIDDFDVENPIKNIFTPEEFKQEMNMRTKHKYILRGSRK